MDAKFKALDIADFYIKIARDLKDDSFDNLKINKMLYFVQAWSLVRLGRPMFKESIQAWEYGPVVPEVYHAFKRCGSLPIESPLDDFDESRLDSGELDVLLNVYRFYGKYTGKALIDLTHMKGSPWQQVYEKDRNRNIPSKLIKKYYEDKELDGFDPDALDIPVVAEIPSSWDSPEDKVYD